MRRCRRGCRQNQTERCAGAWGFFMAYGAKCGWSGFAAIPRSFLRADKAARHFPFPAGYRKTLRQYCLPWPQWYHCRHRARRQDEWHRQSLRFRERQLSPAVRWQHKWHQIRGADGYGRRCHLVRRQSGFQFAFLYMPCFCRCASLMPSG